MTPVPAGTSANDAAPAAVRAGVRWDTSQLSGSFCNVASATSTRKEVVLNFGISPNRDRPGAELEVQLLNRVILDAVAAKQLQQLLTKLITEYESRHGELK